MPPITKVKKGTKTVSRVAVLLIISAVIAVGVGIVTLTTLGPASKLSGTTPSWCLSNGILDSFDTVIGNTGDSCFLQTTLSSNGTEKILKAPSGCIEQEPAVSVTGNVYLNSAHTITGTPNSVAWKYDGSGLHLKLCDDPYSDNSGSFTVKVQWQKEGTFYTCHPNDATRCQLVTGCP